MYCEWPALQTRMAVNAYIRKEVTNIMSMHIVFTCNISTKVTILSFEMLNIISFDAINNKYSWKKDAFIIYLKCIYVAYIYFERWTTWDISVYTKRFQSNEVGRYNLKNIKLEC